jgi:GNAT superfamily N-acetyltransferase
VSIVIESLQRDKHRRLAFSCGEETLDRFLQENAHQACAKNLSKTYVAVDEIDETVILGYYTVTTTQIEAGELPPEVIKHLKLPNNRDVPAQLVAKLAVAENIKGQGVGPLMLMDALTRCVRVSAEVGGVAIVVDALRENLVGFYEHYGFRRFEPDSLKMFITTETVKELIGVPLREREVG